MAISQILYSSLFYETKNEALMPTRNMLKKDLNYSKKFNEFQERLVS